MGVDPREVRLQLSPDGRVRALCDVVCADISELYVLGDELGKGRFSTVRAAESVGSGRRYALKVVENTALNDEEHLEALEQEVRILRMLEHPYIVKLKEVVMTTEQTFISMELLEGGELFDKVAQAGRFPEPQAAAVFARLLIAIEFMHKKGVVHRDLKPENVLFVEAGGKAPTDIKIIDFGYAGIWAPGAELRGLCGTPDYVAPEILSWYEPDSGPNSPLARPEGRVAGVRGGAEGRAQAPAEAEGRGASRAGVVGGAAHADAPGGRAQQLAGGDALAEAPSVSGAGPTATPVSLPGADGGASAPAGSLGAVGVGGGRPYGKASDIWSVGVLLYVLLSGCAPFAAEGEQQLLAKVARADFAFPQREWEAVSDGARDVVRRALVAEPSARATLAELMEHPWCREAVQRALAELRASGALERAGGGKGGRGRGRAAAGCACLVQ